jgi:glycosyltransferase involved in cell wall biosynthesis
MGEQEFFVKKGVLSILMPVYNERAYLAECVKRVLAVKLPDSLECEIIMVDDGSTDGSAKLVDELAKKHPDVISVHHQERNQGKGAAIRKAVELMQGEYAIIQDADLEYDPREYPAMLCPILEGVADVVYGSRFAASPMRRVLNFHHELGNRFITFLSNCCTGLNLTDMETCYKLFRAEVIKTIPLRSNRFGIEPEITAKIAKRYCVVYEIPASYRGRSYSEGKKIGMKDGFRAIYTILKYKILDDCFEERFGHGVLFELSQARNFTRWAVKTIEPYLGDKILEVGSGIGNISRLLPKKEKLTVTDIDKLHINILGNLFSGNAIVDVAKLDLNCDADFAALKKNQYDTLVCMNVLEHIEDDKAALIRMRSILAPGGKLILVVPQYEMLYGEFDRDLDHFRRYSKKGLFKLLEECDFVIHKKNNLNFLSIPGWYINSVILKRKKMSHWQIKIFDKLVFSTKLIEKIFPLPGLSLVCIAEKKSNE